MLNLIVFMFVFFHFLLHSHRVLMLHPEFREVGLQNEVQMNNFRLLLILTFGIFFSKTKKVMGCCFFSAGMGIIFSLR